MKNYFSLGCSIIGLLMTWYWTFHLSFGLFLVIALVVGVGLGTSFLPLNRKIKRLSIIVSVLFVASFTVYVCFIVYALNNTSTVN